MINQSIYINEDPTRAQIVCTRPLVVDKCQKKNMKLVPNIKLYKNYFFIEYINFCLFCNDKGFSKKTLKTKTHKLENIFLNV